MSKAQGFPVATIALIIIILLTIAGLAFFFFRTFWEEEKSTQSVQCQRKCKQVQSIAGSNNLGNDMICSSAKGEEYCSNCNQTCTVGLNDGSTCTINCTDGSCSGCPI